MLYQLATTKNTSWCRNSASFSSTHTHTEPVFEADRIATDLLAVSFCYSHTQQICTKCCGILLLACCCMSPTNSGSRTFADNSLQLSLVPSSSLWLLLYSTYAYIDSNVTMSNFFLVWHLFQQWMEDPQKFVARQHMHALLTTNAHMKRNFCQLTYYYESILQQDPLFILTQSD